MKSIKNDILNCKTISELKTLNLDNGTELEKEIVALVIGNAEDSYEDDEEFDVGKFEMAILRFDDGYAFEAVSEGCGMDCDVENALNVEDWWGAEWDDVSDLKIRYQESTYYKE